MITRTHTYSHGEITAIYQYSYFTWIAFAGTGGNSYLYRVSPFNPEDIDFQVTVPVDRITSMKASGLYLYCSVDDDTYIGARFDIYNPIGSYSYINKPDGITEESIDVAIGDSSWALLIPGSDSGENAKVLIYSGTTLQDTVELDESGKTIIDASSITVDDNDTLWIATNTNPIKLVKLTFESAQQYEVYDISESGETASNCLKIVYHEQESGLNYSLILACNTSPLKIVTVNLESADNPISTVYTFNSSGEDLHYGKNIVINNTFDKGYVACSSGKVVKIDLDNILNRETIELDSESGANDMISIACLNDFYKTFIGTDNSTSLLYEIDEGTVSKISTKFAFLKRITKAINTFFAFIFAKVINTKLAFIARVTTQIDTKLVFLKPSDTCPDPTDQEVVYNTIESLSTEDFIVKVDAVALAEGDIINPSIIIRWLAEDLSTATFTLARYHDKINYTLNNVYSQITANNTVTIEINGRELFTGKIVSIDCLGEEEKINVSCVGEIRNPNYKTTNLPLCGVSERRHLYHIIDSYANIEKPINDYDESGEPTIYKGIKVDLGTEERERLWRFDNTLVPLTALEFEDFIPIQNYTYFWFVTADNWIDTNKILRGEYVGTSLGSISDDLWLIDGITYRSQRTADNLETELGYYYLGEEPYEEINCKKGRYVARTRLEDKENGLYYVKSKNWDYVNYAKEIAQIEWMKRANANGVYPNDANYAITKAGINTTIDGFLFYDLGILTKVNITNTTEVDIYNGNNGFPVRIKEVTIDAKNMKVFMILDNQRTQQELEDLENEYYPDEPEPIEESSRIIALKFDPSRYEDVE